MDPIEVLKSDSLRERAAIPLIYPPALPHGERVARCPDALHREAGRVRGLFAWRARLSGLGTATNQVDVARLTRRHSSKTLTMQERPDTVSSGLECSVRVLLGGRGNPAGGHKGRPYTQTCKLGERHDN